MNSSQPTAGSAGTSSATDTQWLVHCSPERTLVARRRGADVELVKIFEQGSMVDAEEEAAVAKTLAHPSVVPYRGAAKDPVTGKPCVTMDYCEGENLEMLVAREGPLPSGRAAALSEEIALVLADFHGTPRPGMPNGVVHRDIKPANIQLARAPDGTRRVILMDLEHVIAAPAAVAAGAAVVAPGSPAFTGGTHGYAPPESYAGAPPDAGFDVFALGATLFYLLTGSTAYAQREPESTIALVREGAVRRHLLRGQPDALRLLVEDCLATDPERRPTSREVAAALAAHRRGVSPSDATLDRALQAIQATGFDSGAALLEQAAAETDLDHNRHRDLVELAANRRRLWHRIGEARDFRMPAAGGDALLDDALLDDGLLDETRLDAGLRDAGLHDAGLHDAGLRDDALHDDALHGAVLEVTRLLPRLSALLLRFPHLAHAAAARRECARAGHTLLERVLPEVARLKMNAQFDAARELVEAAAATATAIHRVPGGLSVEADPGHLPGPLLRNPALLLQRSLRDVANTERTHGEITARLEDAEAELDLARAGIVIDEITAIYGGASTVAAPLKDRLLRLDFYLQRIAWPRRLLVQITDLLDAAGEPHRLPDVVAFSELCGQRAISEAKVRGKGGARSLLETMHQLIEDFPHARDVVHAAEQALADAMHALTTHAWERLAEAQAKLEAVPIPIRPVQKLLNRLDALRMLEAFVDLSERSRERLQDEIERVRMRLDQARTTRDNIARGAEEAMERGHLTTALFDMARAVDHFEDEAGEADDGAHLADRLEEARRRKQEIERAIVENHRLAARYAELLGEQGEQTDRLEVLEARARILDQMIHALGPDKGTHYTADLREVMLHLVQEKADRGERQLDRAAGLDARLDVARDTLRDLRETARRSGVSQEVGGRVRRLLDHWQFKEHEIRDEIQREQRAALDARRARSRVWLTRAVGIAILAVAGIGTWQVAYGGTRTPELQFTPPAFKIERTEKGLEYPKLQAYVAMSGFVDRLRAAGLSEFAQTRDLELVAISARLVAHLSKHVDGTAPPPDATWALGLENHLQDLDGSLAALRQRIGEDRAWLRAFAVLQSFGRSAHETGLRLALIQRPDPQLLELLESDLRALRHIGLDDDVRRRLRSVVRHQ